MKIEEPIIFNSPTGKQCTPDEVVRGIAAFMRTKKDAVYKVIIGSDSEKTGLDAADFVTAIVCHRVGNGGIYFFRHAKRTNCKVLRNRIWQEVMMSIDIAKDMLERMKKENPPEFGFEVHIDVGEKGPTRELIQELVGVVRANDFEARTKPESYAASKIADRHVK